MRPDPADPLRRRLVAAAGLLPLSPLLGGCAAPLPGPLRPGVQPEARALLSRSAAAHGAASLAAIDDLSVSYAGHWRSLVQKLQPVLVDAGYRGGSEERWLPREHLFGQAHAGPAGRKQVVRRTSSGAGNVRAWFDGEEVRDAGRRDAAALVVDGYALFLLGPMLLDRYWATERAADMELGGAVRLEVQGEPRICDLLRVNIRPGLGFSSGDQLALAIERESGLMRRVRFTLNGLESTRGAVAEVDTLDHLELHGVRWPTRFHEHLRRPFPLAVHDWHLAGLDVNRGYRPADIDGPDFVGSAARAAGAPP